jgi:hypothetical protein
MCLVMVSEAGYGAANGGLGEVPMVAALAILPLLYVVPATRPLWLRHRYLLLAVQAALTYVPFAWFGANWAPSGWLAGLVLLTVPAPASWFVTAILAAIEAALWSGVVVELPNQPTVPAAAWAMIAFVFDALILFGLARLANLITAVHAARDELAEAAVTAERVRAADSLRAAVGGRLAEAAGRSAAALQAIAADPSLAREHIAAAAVTAREALGEVREVAVRYRDAPWPEAVPAEPGELPAPGSHGPSSWRHCAVLRSCTRSSSRRTTSAYRAATAPRSSSGPPRSRSRSSSCSCATPGRHAASPGRAAGPPPSSCRPPSRTRWSRQPAGTR